MHLTYEFFENSFHATVAYRQLILDNLTTLLRHDPSLLGKCFHKHPCHIATFVDAAGSYRAIPYVPVDAYASAIVLWPQLVWTLQGPLHSPAMAMWSLMKAAEAAVAAGTKGFILCPAGMALRDALRFYEETLGNGLGWREDEPASDEESWVGSSGEIAVRDDEEAAVFADNEEDLSDVEAWLGHDLMATTLGGHEQNNTQSSVQDAGSLMLSGGNDSIAQSPILKPVFETSANRRNRMRQRLLRKEARNWHNAQANKGPRIQLERSEPVAEPPSETEYGQEDLCSITEERFPVSVPPQPTTTPPDSTSSIRNGSAKEPTEQKSSVKQRRFFRALGEAIAAAEQLERIIAQKERSELETGDAIYEKAAAITIQRAWRTRLQAKAEQTADLNRPVEDEPKGAIWDDLRPLDGSPPGCKDEPEEPASEKYRLEGDVPTYCQSDWGSESGFERPAGEQQTGDDVPTCFQLGAGYHSAEDLLSRGRLRFSNKRDCVGDRRPHPTSSYGTPIASPVESEQVRPLTQQFDGLKLEDMDLPVKVRGGGDDDNNDDDDEEEEEEEEGEEDGEYKTGGCEEKGDEKAHRGHLKLWPQTPSSSYSLDSQRPRSLGSLLPPMVPPQQFTRPTDFPSVYLTTPPPYSRDTNSQTPTASSFSTNSNEPPPPRSPEFPFLTMSEGRSRVSVPSGLGDCPVSTSSEGPDSFITAPEYAEYSVYYDAKDLRFVRGEDCGETVGRGDRDKTVGQMKMSELEGMLRGFANDVIWGVMG